MSVSLVFVADQTAPAVRVSLDAHLDALLAVQNAGVAIDALLLAHSPDPAVKALVEGVAGARSAVLERYQGVGRAWEAGWPLCEGDYIYLGTACSVPDQRCLRLLVKALDADHDVGAALPTSGTPGGVLVRRAALLALQQVHGAALSPGRPAVFVVERLAHDLSSAGVPVRVVPEARLGALPLRQEASVAVPGWFTGALRQGRPGAVTIGPWTYFTGTDSALVTLSELESIRIGAYCSIADQVRLVNPHHSSDPVEGDTLRLRLAHRPETATTFPIGNRWQHVDGFDDARAFAGRGGTLTVGNDVWIGYGALVVGSVTIGDGAIVGAGAVVVKDVEPYTVVGGNPARVLKRRVDEATAAALLRIAWWDWPEDVIAERVSWFLRPVEEFAREFDPGTRR